MGSIFQETIRRNFMSALYWGIGLAAMACLLALMLPLIDALDITAWLETMPPIVLRAMGVGEDVSFIGTPEGFIAVGFFSKFALIFAVYPVIAGLNVTSNDESNGTLDVLLSLPVSRGRLILETVAAYMVFSAMIVVLVFAGLILGLQFVSVEVDFGRLLVLVLNLLPLLFFVLAFTVFVGALVGRRQLAIGIVTAYIVGSFMIQTIAGLAEGSIAEAIGALSFFSYYDAAGIIQEGFIWWHVAGLAGVALALLFGALFIFQRRDLQTVG